MPTFPPLIGDRFGLVRLLVLPAAVSDVLVLDSPGRVAPLAVWVFALGSAVVSLVAGYRPLTVTVAQCLLVIGAAELAGKPPVTLEVMTSLALVELTVRRWGWPTLAGAAVITATYAGHAFAAGIANGLYSIAWSVVVPVLVGAYLRSQRENVRQSRARAVEAEQRRELGTQAARLAERTAVARELHDVVAHHVASIALRVAVAQHVLPDTDPRVSEVLDDVHAAATTALADLRHLVALLRDPNAVHADLGSLLVQPAELPAALGAVVDRSTQSGLCVDATIDPAVAGLDAVSGLVVLRLVQEGLTNVAKHAGPAARARLRVDLAGDETVRVEVCDDGGEPADHRADSTPGHGLAGLRERVALVGGRIEAGPAAAGSGGVPDPGWRLAAVVPTGPAAA